MVATATEKGTIMRKVLGTLVIALAAFLFTGPTFAHGGKSHRLMGTVKEVQPETLVVTSADGHDMTVAVSDKTKYEQDGKAVPKTALTVGVRVSVQLSEDDKSAVTVKIAPPHEGH